MWSRVSGRAANAFLGAAGGIGGDFTSVLPALPAANGADVVFSTVDTVGIPLLLLKRIRVLRRPLVYASIGLPERLAKLRNDRMRRVFRQAIASAQTVIAYAIPEAEELRKWSTNAHFVPFGVDVEAFSPAGRVAPEIDVLSVGADPLRDFELLLAIAARRPELTFRIVTTADRLAALGPVPQNVSTETDLPLEKVRERLMQARAVALPVRENDYSGATTTLLQAMAMAKPVVVSRTAAIATGYGLEDGFNCRLVPPQDAPAFERALIQVLGDDVAFGHNARRTAERFSWTRYTDTLWKILNAAVHEKGPDPR